MMVGIQASQAFSDYSIFLSGIAAALYRLEDSDKEFTIMSAGPSRLNEMAYEFINVSNFKARGVKAKVVKVPETWIKNNHFNLDRFAYFCNEKEPISNLSRELDKKDVNVQVYRYTVAR